MFANLRTGTKLFILSGMFFLSIAVTTYSLVAEKQAAVNFARKELAGSRYLAVVRDIYGAVVTGLTDDAAVAEWAGLRPHIFDGDADNVKVTTLQDLAQAEARLFNQAADIRVGQGFDVHAFVAGDHVWLVAGTVNQRPKPGTLSFRK